MAVAMFGLSSTLSSVSHAETKVGFVYVGPIGDHGWTYQHDRARLAVEKALGSKVKTTFVESVKEGPDSERVIRQLASSGHELIFTTSFGFMNPTLKAAKKFGNVKFEHATGYKQAKNVGTYSARFYEGRYIAGVIAGKVSKTNKIGYIGAYPIAEVIMGINAFAQGLRSVNKDASISVIWANTWYDPVKEADAAKVHIAEGAEKTESHQENRNILLSKEATAQSVPNLEILCDDVICSHGSSVGPIEENVYHYVMSRGIKKVDADKLLIKGFFNDKDKAFAKFKPTLRQIIKPGPDVAATADILSRVTPLSSKAFFAIKLIFSTCDLAANSGTTPPNSL